MWQCAHRDHNGKPHPHASAPGCDQEGQSIPIREQAATFRSWGLEDSTTQDSSRFLARERNQPLLQFAYSNPAALTIHVDGIPRPGPCQMFMWSSQTPPGKFSTQVDATWLAIKLPPLITVAYKQIRIQTEICLTQSQGQKEAEAHLVRATSHSGQAAKGRQMSRSCQWQWSAHWQPPTPLCRLHPGDYRGETVIPNPPKAWKCPTPNKLALL